MLELIVKITIKGSHILVDNYQCGQGKSIKVEGKQAVYLNSYSGDTPFMPRVLALTGHAVFLARPDQKDEVCVLLVPQTAAGEVPVVWNPALPSLWHAQGGFWPLELSGASEELT